MGFNKRLISFDKSVYHLKNGSLDQYYGTSDALEFQDEESFIIFKAYHDGDSEENIIEIINLKNGVKKL
jgi:hypothetical protein